MHDAFSRIEDFLRVFIRKAFRGVDNRLAEPGVFDVCILVEREDGRDGETIFIRLEGAKVVREDFGEHRDGAVDQVHACRAFDSFFVERGAGPHEKRDIGNVYAHFDEAAVNPAHRKRVVEVLCIKRVDGAGRDISEVPALRVCRFLRERRATGFLESFCIGHNAGRELRGESLAKRQSAHLGLMHTRFPDDLLDSAERVLFVCVPAREAYESFVSHLCLPAVEDDNRHMHFLVVGRKQRETIFLHKRAHKGLPCAGDDFHHLSRCSRRHSAGGVAVAACRSDFNDVARKRVARPLGRNDEILRVFIRREKADALAGHRDGALVERIRRHLPYSSPVTNQSKWRFCHFA